MKKKMVAIGLFPDRMDLLVVQGGRVTASRRLPMTFETSADDWAGSLRKAGPWLTDTVRELKLTGWSASVLYVSPTAFSEYVSVKASSASEASQAAVLNASDSLGYPLMLASTGTAVISTDGGSASNKSSKIQDGMTHLVVAAERDDHSTALADLVQDSGLKLWSATPIQAGIMMKVAMAALTNASARSAHLYVGEHRSFFVVVESGKLVFSRPVGLGIHALATSLTRPLRPAQGCEPVELDPQTASSMLHSFGFPNRQQIVHEALGLTGAQIIPLLQPVLQRFVVELRQSLRFGVPEEHRQSLTINFTGPGCCIPGFAEIVANELRLNVEVDKSYASFDGTSPDAPGSELMDAIGDEGALSRLNVQPREMTRARQINKLQRWMWTGGAAALVMVGIDAMHIRESLRTTRAEADAIAARNTEAQSMHASSQKMLGAIEAMTSLENSVAAQVGAQVNFRACMQEIASLVPSSIKLTEIRFTQTDDKTMGSVLGYSFPDDHSRTSDVTNATAGVRKSDLETFIARLKESPLFDKVALGNVQIASVDSKSAQQFEVGVTGVAVPVLRSPAPASASTTTSSPAPSAQANVQEGSQQ